MSLTRIKKRRFPWAQAWDEVFNDTWLDDDFFNTERNLPAMNIINRDAEIQIELAAPGFEKENFNVNIQDNILEISAEKKTEKEEKEEEYTRKEFSFNTFRRQMQVPAVVDTEKPVKATYTNGILSLVLPKKEADKSRARRNIKVG